MATFYLDLEGGSDAADGTSFANRWKTITSGATAARIAPGDTIRLMASPDPTSLGNATWTTKLRDAAMPATTNISAVSNATPIVITTSAAHGLATDDVVQIAGQTGNRYVNGLWKVTVLTTTTFELVDSVAAGAGGTATGTVRLYNAKAIKLATACNKSIDMCEVAWTASANVTATVSTTRKQGDGSASLAIAAGFTTGKVAYRTLPATIDLSGYQQVTLWIRTNVNFAAADFDIRLCSDTTGDTPVDTLNLPAMTGTNRWVPITIDKGSALGASIASIAIYGNVDIGAVTLLLDNIAAVKSTASADSLGLQSLISKNVAGETFYPLASIEGTVLSLDAGATGWNGTQNNHMGWVGTTETVETFKVDPISMTMVASGDIGLTVQDSGTDGNQITFSGGWNRTDMSTQTGMTWIDCRNGVTLGLSTSGKSYITLSKIGIVRASTGLSFESGGTGLVLTDIHSNGNDNQGMIVGSFNGLSGWSNIFVCNNAAEGVQLGRSNNGNTRNDYGDAFVKVNCNGGLTTSRSGIIISCHGCTFGIIGSVSGNNFAGIAFNFGSSGIKIEEVAVMDANGSGGIMPMGCSDIVINKITKADGNGTVVRFGEGNTGSDMRILELHSDANASSVGSTGNSDSPGAGIVRVRRWTATDTTPSQYSATGELRVAVDRWGDTVDDHRIFGAGYTIQSETSVRHTASGIAWRIAPTSTIRTTIKPIILPIAQIAVVANKLVTVKAWLRRTHTELTLGIRCLKSQLTGITTTQSAEMTAAADTWEEVTITFTPTEAGVVEIEAYAYGGTTRFGYVDDLTLTQAA